MATPGDVTANTLRRGDVAIDYAVYGADSGVPLLMAMGLGMQRTAWPASLLDALCARGFRCITFDNRDIGLSTRYDASGVPRLHRVFAARLLQRRFPTPYTLADIADDGVALLDHLGIARAHVLGMSMGGMIAQHVASRHSARVDSLTLMSTTSGRLGLPLPAAQVMRLMLSRPDPRSGMAVASDYVVRMFSAIGSPGFPTPREDMQRRAEAGLRRAPSGHGISRQIAAIVSDGDRTPMLRKLEARTLILHGHDDPMVPIAHGRQLAAVIPKARLHDIRGWGHDLPDALNGELAQLIAAHALLA